LLSAADVPGITPYDVKGPVGDVVTLKFAPVNERPSPWVPPKAMLFEKRPLFPTRNCVDPAKVICALAELAAIATNDAAPRNPRRARAEAVRVFIILVSRP
jgi:hypothetical protein